MTVLAFTFTKLVVRDLDVCERFYCDGLGMKNIGRNTATDHEYAQEEIFLSLTGTADGNVLILTRYLELPRPAPGSAWVGFAVSDMEATLAAAEKAGGKIVGRVHEFPGHSVRAATLIDPEGHMIELVEQLQSA